MKVLNQLSFPGKNFLTIGNFDGVHLGHQVLLKRLKNLATASQATTVVITFKNHPSEVLRPKSAAPLLCTFEHKLKLIAEQGIDVLIPLNFNRAFSLQSAEAFLQKVRPFSYLLLGPDATLGKDRQGDRQHLEALAAAWGFSLEYLDPISIEGTKVSSSKIRELIQKGELLHAEKFLGRKFSIYSKVRKGLGLGKRIGFPTLNMEVKRLCLPPFGVYAVNMIYEGQKLKGVANLGIAPTVRQNNIPILEVHLLDFIEKMDSDQWIEIIFCEYIRPEIRFESLDQLKEQIGKDVQLSRKILENKI